LTALAVLTLEALCFSSITAVAVASASRRVPPVHIQLQADHDVTRCTGGVPDSWEVAAWVYANGHDLHAASAVGFVMYYAGDGTLVKLTAEPHDGPICVRAITWQPSVRVLIAFRVLRVT
jgi:hypothetical protein